MDHEPQGTVDTARLSQIAADFILGHDWPSRLIAWFGQGAGGWSHVAPVLADGRYLDSRSDVLGGVPAGVHIRLPETEGWVKKQRVSLEVSPETYAEWEANLRARIGDAYGKADIEGFITGKPLHTKAQWICSAHFFNSLQHVKLIPYPLTTPAHQITPDGAFLAVQILGFTIGPVITQKG